MTDPGRPDPQALEWLSWRHPGRCADGLEAALHACAYPAELAVDDADRLLLDTRGGPEPSERPRVAALDEVTTNDR